jgi:uncharacterized DUF497 family protein
MHVYIQWDEEKRRMNLREHGVDFIDLESFFEGELLTQEDERYGYAETRFQSIGMLGDRVVFVVWTPADDEGTTLRLISARKATQRETQAWFDCYGTRH